MLQEFDPPIAVHENPIKVAFLPVKRKEGKFIKDLYVVKIIVAQGNPTRLYSVTKKEFRGYLRNDG